MTDEATFQQEAARKIAAEDAAASRADAAERVKNQMSIADQTMKALMLANGGAMIALFTFIGNLVAGSAIGVPFDRTKLWIAFACFVAGLVAALLCHLAAFASQDRFYNQSMHEAYRHQALAHGVEPTSTPEQIFGLYKQGMIAYAVGLALAAVSMVTFAVGAGFALAGVLIN